MPAYRIQTPRLLLRCWLPSDAPRVMAAIERSLEHLRRRMDWAMNEPESVARKAERLRRFRTRFDSGEEFVYGVFDRREEHVLGGLGLHRRIGAGAAEIGYWIHVDHVNQGLATEAAAAVTRVGFEIEKLRRIEIHCDPRNVASASVPRKLGYTHQVTVVRWVNSANGTPRDTMIWVLLREDYPASPAAAADLEAFNDCGQAIL